MAERLCRLKNCFDNNGRKRNFFGLYTVFFCVTAFFIFSWFIFSGKSLIYQEDGWIQHFKALVYYGQYLRKIIRELLFNHQLVIPEWDFTIGEGNDILSTLHYYAMGDPIALFSVFVPTRFMHYFFTFSCILRLYLAGIAFSVLCFGTGVKNRCGILAGALSYSFCSWAALNAGRHPFFLNPLIYFPLIILGVEKIIHKKRPYLFILATALAAASNFYFFYMIALLTATYAIFRVFLLYKTDIKAALFAIFRIGVSAVSGLALAAVIFLPVFWIFLQDSRIGISQPFHFLYPLSYYSQLPSIAVTKNKSYWLYLGFNIPVILAMYRLLIKDKQAQLLRMLLLTCIGICLLPVGGRILNGMSYMTNRWVWAFALLAAYILAREWNPLLSLPAGEWKSLLLFSVCYYVACLLFEKSRNSMTLSTIPLFFICLVILKDGGPQAGSKKQALLLLVVIVSTVNVEFWLYSPGVNNYIAEFLENKDIRDKEWNNNETALVKSVATEEYPRYTGRAVTENVNLVSGISNTQYYWSLSNPYMNQFRSELSMRESLYYRTYGYDDRTTPIALSAAGYYVAKPGDNLGLPYGFKRIGAGDVQAENREKYLRELKAELNTEHLSDAQAAKLRQALQNSYEIYENQFKLPLGYSYDSYMTKETYGLLDPVQKQEVQLSAAVLEAPAEGISLSDMDVPDYSIPFVAEPDWPEVTCTVNFFVATADNTKVRLRLETPVKDAEVYVGFDNLEFKVTPEYDLYFGDDAVDPLCLYNKTNWKLLSHDRQTAIRKSKLFLDATTDADIVVRSSSGVSKLICYMQPDSPYSSGRHDYIANLGYTTDEIGSISITLPKRGIYSFDSLKVYRVPMDSYAQKTEALSKDSLRNVHIGVDCIRGEFSADSNKILCIAVPYSKGWFVYVDGQKQDVLLVNSRHIGAALPAGHHTVRFEYHRPLQHAGLLVSAAAAVLFPGFIAISEKKRRF